MLQFGVFPIAPKNSTMHESTGLIKRCIPVLGTVTPQLQITINRRIVTHDEPFLQAVKRVAVQVSLCGTYWHEDILTSCILIRPSHVGVHGYTGVHHNQPYTHLPTSSNKTTETDIMPSAIVTGATGMSSCPSLLRIH
jgi:4-amino-4-deoxy-L-arabinose transferase-like glycosyltransferase